MFLSKLRDKQLMLRDSAKTTQCCAIDGPMLRDLTEFPSKLRDCVKWDLCGLCVLRGRFFLKSPLQPLFQALS